MREEIKGLILIEEYTEKDNPLELYDGKLKFHLQTNKNESRFNFDDMDETEYMFLIAMAQNTNRPLEVLMFLGEYFKRHLKESFKVTLAKQDEESKDENMELNDFFITADAMNFLAIGNKMFTDTSRQELRISIAVSRCP